jgi:hypothetical protein
MHEFGWLENGTTRAGQLYAETAAVTVGDGDNRFHVTQIEHNFEGDPQILAYRFFVSDRANGPERMAGPYLVSRSDGLVDCRFSGRHMRMRVEAVADGPWALGKARLDIKPGGAR